MCMLYTTGSYGADTLQLVYVACLVAINFTYFATTSAALVNKSVTVSLHRQGILGTNTDGPPSPAVNHERVDGPGAASGRGQTVAILHQLNRLEVWNGLKTTYNENYLHLLTQNTSSNHPFVLMCKAKPSWVSSHQSIDH